MDYAIFISRRDADKAAMRMRCEKKYRNVTINPYYHRHEMKGYHIRFTRAGVRQTLNTAHLWYLQCIEPVKD